MAKTDPITGRRIKTGGRKTGTPNRATSARMESMARVNEALAAMGDDALTGTKLLQEVLRHPDTPLEVKIQCAGLVLKQETPSVDNQIYVTRMPLPLPGDQDAQVALWWALYSGEENHDPEWDAAAKIILEKASTKKRPETL